MLTHARHAAGIEGAALLPVAADWCEEAWSGDGRDSEVLGPKSPPGPRSPTWESWGESLLEMDRAAGDVPYKSMVGRRAKQQHTARTRVPACLCAYVPACLCAYVPVCLCAWLLGVVVPGAVRVCCSTALSSEDLWRCKYLLVVPADQTGDGVRPPGCEWARRQDAFDRMCRMDRASGNYNYGPHLLCDPSLLFRRSSLGPRRMA